MTQEAPNSSFFNWLTLIKIWQNIITRGEQFEYANEAVPVKIEIKLNTLKKIRDKIKPIGNTVKLINIEVRI